MMTTLDRILIEKSGCENGWEHIVQSDGHAVILASARHQARVLIQKKDDANAWTLCVPGGLIERELKRSFPSEFQGNSFHISGLDHLGVFLNRAAGLALSLPNQALHTYQSRVKDFRESEDLATETERLVKQRIGQSTFREALLDYWGGACAVTGLDLPEILRASHAKPWAHCETDAERLDVFNGFLLSANLDALFDRGLITFENNGMIRISPNLSIQQIEIIPLDDSSRLRWIAEEHRPFLEWHRNNIFR